MAGKQREDSLTIEDKLKVALVPEDEQPYPIPENWVWCTLNNILNVKYGKGLKKENRTDGEYSVYGSNGIVGFHDKPLTKGPTIIIGRKGSVGEVHYSQAKCWPIDTTYYIDDLFMINYSFLFYLLRNLELKELDKSTAIPGINRNDLYSIIIPLPPLTEQQRIAKKLESLLGKIKEAKALLDEVPEILQNFRQTVLTAACSGRLTEDWRKENPDIKSAGELLKRKKNSISNAHLKKLPSVSELINDDLPSKWAFATLPYLVSNKKYSIKRGPFGSSLRKEYFVESGYKVYEQQHAIKNDFTLGTYYISGDKFNELKAFELNEGDLIMSCSGTIGRLAVVPHTFEKGIINQALLKLTLDNEVILTDFFLFMFKDYLTKQEFASLTKGNAITNIASVTELKKIYFPLPPLPEQQEIVRRVESLFNKAGDLEAQYKEAMEFIESLPEIILSKAFRGELVPQDPNDEPAFGLLERITFEKEKHETEKVEGTKRKKHKQNV